MSDLKQHLRLVFDMIKLLGLQPRNIAHLFTINTDIPWSEIQVNLVVNPALILASEVVKVGQGLTLENTVRLGMNSKGLLSVAHQEMWLGPKHVQVQYITVLYITVLYITVQYKT